MTLENYIKELLYRYDCVIVPDFGAFISNSKSAKVSDKKFTPPYKQVTFNSLIQNNDGLLANHIAQTDKMPYDTALNFIKFEVEEWVNKLLDEELNLEGIGNFSIVDDNIHFEADTTINYLTSSFGLSSFISNSIIREAEQTSINNNREEYKNQVEKLEKQALIYINEDKRKKPTYFLKYAAVFMLGASIIGLLGKKAYDDNLNKKQIIALEKQQKVRENEIQTATFVINSPLPTITINTVEPVKKFHIIAGAFRNESNARKKVTQLNKKGFDASIVGENKWNLSQVAFQSFSSLEKANKALAKIKRNTAKDAWILVK
ncbi:MAG TPA: SPOR domain-containing protein [Flavobacteriaceae bacterium]|nr:SPOR domain-containing protein [Flavobacteriaceae bacterium]